MCWTSSSRRALFSGSALGKPVSLLQDRLRRFPFVDISVGATPRNQTIFIEVGRLGLYLSNTEGFMLNRTHAFSFWILIGTCTATLPAQMATGNIGGQVPDSTRSGIPTSKITPLHAGTWPTRTVPSSDHRGCRAGNLAWADAD